MSKKRIRNYVFLPGTALSSNAFPNAYELLLNNKAFLQKESNAYIQNSIAIDQAVNLNPNAVAYLTTNKSFLQEEVAAYITAQVAASAGPFVGYTFDAAKCKRDTGYIIDAYIYDLRYGGNEQTRFVASQYWLSGVAQVDGDRLPEVWAHSKMRDIINKFVLPGISYVTQQSPVVQPQVITGTHAPETHIQQRVSSLAFIITDVITNGLSVLQGLNNYPNGVALITANKAFLKDEITAWIAKQVETNTAPFVNFEFNALKCKRDIGYIIDAYVYDITNGGTEKIREAVQQYWLGGVAQVDGSRAAEVAAHTKLRDVINNFILPRTTYPTDQNPIITTQVTSLPSTEAGVSTLITTLAGITTSVISGGLAALAAVNLRPNAVTLLTNNKEFLKDEITAWIAAQVAGNISPFVGYTYDSAKCKRDAGFVIDGYTYDLRYGGTEGTRDIFQQYWIGTTAQVDGDRSPEIAAHTQLATIINDYIFTRTLYTTQQSPITSTQNTTGSNAEADADDIVDTLSGIFLNVLADGLEELPTMPVTQSLRNFAGYAYDTSKCERDVGYVLDAYINDLRYGGNIETRFVASRYWEGQVAQIDGDRRPELVTHQFIRDIINFYVFTQDTYTQLQGTVQLYTNNNITYESGAPARIYTLANTLLNVIENGLSSLPARQNGVTQLKIQGKYNLDEFLLITNTTNNQVLYNFASNQYGGEVSFFATYNSNGFSRDDDYPSFLQIADYVTSIRLDVNTSSSSSTDDVQIFVESDEQTIRPWDFGTDAIERMRVAAPQSMLDADFEYGLQPTKWQAIGLLRGYPSVYEIPGSDQAVISVVTDASIGTASVGSSLITVTVSGAHGLTVGAPFTIKALANTITGFSRAEGTFLVNSIPSPTTFTYYATARVGTTNGQVLATTYTQLRKAAFYTGASVGSPTFSVFSNGNSGSIDTQFNSPTASDSIAFTGAAPIIGSPLSGTGIATGTQISGVVGNGGIVVSTTIQTNTSPGVNTLEIDNPSGVLEGLGIDRGDGQAIFINSISGNTVTFTGNITNSRVGSTAEYTSVTGADVAPIGTGASFNFQRLNGNYVFLGVAEGGQNYKVGDKVRIDGADLEGASTTNDIVITILATESGGSISNTDSAVGISFTGTSASGAVTYTALPQDATSGSGINSSFTVIRTDTGDSTAGTYSVSVVNPGSSFAPGDTITIFGGNLGGGAPNDLTITVGLTGLFGAIDTFTFSGQALGTDKIFSDLVSTNVAQPSFGAVFTVERSGGDYTVQITNGGSDYVVGNQIIVSGNLLGGTTPANNLLITVNAVDAGVIEGVAFSGTAINGDAIDFYSVIQLSAATTIAIGSGTTLNYTGIAQIEVAFLTAHGLIPGASITTAITSSGTNHALAGGPFYVESTPTPETLRYTARTSGTVQTAVPLTGILYTRSDSYFIHRPYDGGVQLGTGGPQHGAQAIRMSKKYIRYQSGKGIMYTTGALFAPSYDIQSINASGTTVGSFITVVLDDVDHGCQVGGVITITGIETAGYNGEYTVSDVVNERQLVVQATSVLSNVYGTIGPAAKISLKRWHGATVRAGAFDEQNGIFWQYNGNQLAVGLRSSTFQIAGTVNITKDTNLMTGSNTRFRDQLKAGDKIVIKGMTHVITRISSQTSLTVSPDYRGAVDAVSAKLCKIEDIIVTQDKFNRDRLDGTGPSGYNVNTSTMQMIGIQYSWYGAGFIDFMLRGSDGNYIFAHRIRNSNVNTEAYMRTGNLPVRYEVINESATGKLASSITATQTTLPLLDASEFPDDSGLVYVDNELIAFTGKSGNTLTGCTRSAPLTNFVAGASRTFRGGSASTHEYNTGVVLVSTTISPIISHWGSAFLTDGLFDEDRGYIFSYASTGVSVTTTKQTAFLIRLAPSVSNAIVGDLGERELLNRAQLLLKSVAVTSDTGSGGIVIEGVLNPSNYPTDPTLITWGALSGLSAGGQPSFAQIAPGGSVSWSSATQTTATATTTADINGNLVVPNKAVFARSSGTNILYVTQTSWSTINASTGFLINDGKYPAGTTISTQTASPSPVATTINEASGSARIRNDWTFSTNVLYVLASDWNSLTNPSNATGMRPTSGFPAGTFVTAVSSSFFTNGRQVYQLTFSQFSTSAFFNDQVVTFSLGGTQTTDLSRIYFTSGSWNALPLDVPAVGTATSDANFAGGTTISAITATRTFAGTSYVAVTFSNAASAITGGTTVTFSTIPYFTLTLSSSSTSSVAANANVQLTLRQSTTNTNFAFITQASWETLVSTYTAGIGTEIADAKFPAGARISNVSALSTFASTNYYRLTFNQTSTAAITASSTITFRFGQPPYALPGETVFSFIAAPGESAELDLGELKELTNTTLGGRGTYPNGPDVLAINVYKASGTALNSNIILRWGEAQA